MKSRSFALASAFVAAATTQMCFAGTPAATVPIEKLFSALNSDSGVRLSETYAPDAVIVDEFAPYVWRGPTAGTAFWTSFLAIRKSFKLTKIHATHGPLVFLSYDEAKNTAYLVAPTTITDNSAGKPESETGQWVFVVKNISGTWFIENSSWATEKYAHG